MKYAVELLVLLLLSLGIGLLFPSFLRASKIEIRSISEFVITSVAAFALLSCVYFAYLKQKK